LQHAILKVFAAELFMQENKIIVLDFGAQYAHLIARRIRELHVYSEIKDPTASIEELKKAKGIILSGGPSSVYEKNAPAFNKKIFQLEIPILGLCYGHQLMAQETGGKVKPGKVKEFGTAKLEIKKFDKLFEGLRERENVWMSHGDSVAVLPPGFESIASTEDCPIAAMGNFEKNFFGLQFHPEVTHTVNGMKILSNFVFKICNCKADWTIKNYLEKEIAEIKEKVGGKNVFMLASGGVDSTVALALLNKALPAKRVYAMHVDTGFMRKDEAKLVEKTLRNLKLSELHVVNASKEFFSALKGVIEPEKKRKIIGNLFIEIQNHELKQLKLDPDTWLLGQGTIYPDTIETAGTKHAAKIKTHHNRVESIKQMIEEGKVIEPLAQLYKDEVRELGELLGLPKELVWRHPFPGPGLAIRALCSNGKEKIPQKLGEKANEIAQKYLLKATVLPIKSVGVQGDARTYRHPAVLEGELDWKELEKASTETTNKLKEINRCVFALQPEKIKSVKIIKADLNQKRIALLQEADAIVMDAVQKHGLEKAIWQFPTILLPIEVNGTGKESIVLRPVESREAMTARFYKMDEKILKEIVNKLMKLEIGAVFYDVTHKPPGTIEWE